MHIVHSIVVCCIGFVSVYFTHILKGYSTATGTIKYAKNTKNWWHNYNHNNKTQKLVHI